MYYYTKPVGSWFISTLNAQPLFHCKLGSYIFDCRCELLWIATFCELLWIAIFYWMDFDFENVCQEWCLFLTFIKTFLHDEEEFLSLFICAGSPENPFLPRIQLTSLYAPGPGSWSLVWSPQEDSKDINIRCSRDIWKVILVRQSAYTSSKDPPPYGELWVYNVR